MSDNNNTSTTTLNKNNNPTDSKDNQKTENTQVEKTQENKISSSSSITRNSPRKDDNINRKQEEIEERPPTAVLFLQDLTHDNSIPRIIFINKQKTSIGRLDTDYIIESSKTPKLLSRYHCTIYRKEVEDKNNASQQYRYYISDQKSLNGTFVNGYKVKEQEITNQDVINFGSGAKVNVGQELPMEALSSAINYEFLLTETDDQKREFENRKRSIFKRKFSLIQSQEKTDEESQEIKRRRTNSQGHYHSITSSPSSSSSIKHNDSPSQEEKSLSTIEEQRQILERRTKELEQEIEQLKNNNNNNNNNSIINQQQQQQQYNEISPEITEELKCSICQSLIFQAVSLRCSHTFCRACLGMWLKSNDTCPSCRKRCKSKIATASMSTISSSISSSSSSSATPTPIGTAMLYQKTFANNAYYQNIHNINNNNNGNRKNNNNEDNKAHHEDIHAIRNRLMDTLIDKMLPQLPQELANEYREQKTQFEQEEQEALHKLQKSVKQAQSKNLRFFNIRDRWNIEYKKAFISNVSKHSGKSRKYYCGLVGLTEEFVSKATIHQLLIALDNLQLPHPPSVPGHGIDVENAKERLLEFISPIV